MTPAETLRAAADRLEALDKAATPGPWIPEGDRIEANFWSTDQEEFSDVLVTGGLAEACDYTLISVLRGAVAPLAASLRESAEELVTYRDAKGVPEDHAARLYRRELDVARTILGTQP